MTSSMYTMHTGHDGDQRNKTPGRMVALVSNPQHTAPYGLHRP